LLGCAEVAAGVVPGAAGAAALSELQRRRPAKATQANERRQIMRFNARLREPETPSAEGRSRASPALAVGL
jgi:hypothetical protein